MPRAKHSFAIKNDGTLWGWGHNTGRQLGDGTTTNVNTPKKIGTANDWKSVSCGELNTLAIKNDGSLWGWGSNQRGELGQSDTQAKVTPTLTSSEQWMQVSTGNYMTAGIKMDGSLWIWGTLVSSGGSWYEYNRPLNVVNSSPNLANLKWANVAVGDRYMLAVTQDGKLYGYGWNVNQQVQAGLSDMVHIFQLLSQDTNWVNVCPTSDFSMALKKDGTLWAWGYGQNSNIGGYGKQYPTLTTPTHKWSKIVGTSRGTVLGLKSDGTLWSFGSTANGALGRLSTAENQFVPTQIDSSKYTQIAAGEGHFYALKTNGTVCAWGLNDFGQVGDGTQTNVTAPIQILTDVSNLGERQDYSWNTAPTVSLTSPTINQILFENSSLSITGTAIDSDSGNTVTIRYQVNAETVRTIKSFISNGISVESFAKSLSFKNGKLYDGDTAITGALTEGTYHSLKVWVEDDKGGKSAEQIRTFTVVLNRAPVVTVTAPTANKTLYENDVFTINGTAIDSDSGNTVTIRYQVNAETVRSIKAFLSDGTTVESFTKSLSFKSGKLHDGETEITGNLTDGVAHKLKIWATDDKNGISSIIERDFYVVPNRAPILTVNPPIINGNIDNDKFTINGSYNDADGNATTVKYRINGSNSVQVASGTSGAFDFELSFAQLIMGPNTIVIEAVDSYGAKTSKTVKLNKNVVETAQLKSTARYKISPPTNKAQAVLLWIERDKDLTLDVSVSMTMAGEAESFVPVTVSESVPIAAGSTTYEDTFFYEADAPKDNIIVQIDMTRKSIDADDKITLISGVLE